MAFLLGGIGREPRDLLKRRVFNEAALAWVVPQGGEGGSSRSRSYYEAAWHRCLYNYISFYGDTSLCLPLCKRIVHGAQDGSVPLERTQELSSTEENILQRNVNNIGEGILEG